MVQYQRILVGDTFVDLDAHGDRIVASLRKGVPFEARSLAIWANLCSQGGHVVDVGCYSGLYAISAVKLGATCTAFEPMPQNAVRCSHNALVNGVEFTLHEAAATIDGVNEVAIHFNPRVPGNTSGAYLGSKKDNDLGLTVRAMSIDSLQLEQCTAIKIDVERAEHLVLAGARQTLDRCRPALLLEVLDDVCKALVQARLPDYRVIEEVDDRNWLLVPA